MPIDQILKRNFWAVILVMIAVAALFDAQGLMQLVGASLSVDEKALAAPPPGSKGPLQAAQASTRNLSSEPILSRNPFDSVTGPLNKPPPVAEAPPTPTGPDLSDPYRAPPCDGVKVLIIAASTDPEWSFAAMTSGGDPKSQLRRRGGEIGSKKVIFVGWDRVWLTQGSTLCQAQMFKPAGGTPPPAASASAAPPPPPTGGATSVPPDIAKGIVRVSANEFNIDRSVVDKILENQADLMRQARIVPEQENGKLVGIRLFGVKADTLLGALGMENGDRLQTINGFDMTSPEKALEAYARLRTADHLTVQLNRRGSGMNLDYNIK